MKALIFEAKVEQIKCMEYQCYQKIDENFILKHIKNDHILLEKYEKFKLRAEIINDPNKKQCPQQNCESFLKKLKNDNFVKCQKGHKFCFECLRPWHEGDSCEKIMEKEFLKWKKNKVIKKCPRCKIYTEKNEGCNHMTCSNCQYQWCWLCEEKYNYGHYNQGKCKGLQFVKADNIDGAIRRIEPRYFQNERNEDYIINNNNNNNRLCRRIICNAIYQILLYCFCFCLFFGLLLMTEKK